MTGIDYGSGLTNIDHDTGIRYGVIHHGTVGSSWYDSADSDYGTPTCPTCGNDVLSSSNEKSDEVDASEWYTNKDYYCVSCETCYWSDSVFGEEPIAFTFEDGEYSAHQSGDDCDIFVFKSPYYTLCSYCSPCAPGAGYLTSQAEDGIKAYCFGSDWFEDDKAPYDVYRVSDNVLVAKMSAEDEDDTKAEDEDSSLTHAQRLAKVATDSAVFRGHTLGSFAWIHTEQRVRGTAVCVRCHATAHVDTRPEPNDIDISGTAVSIGCTDDEDGTR